MTTKNDRRSRSLVTFLGALLWGFITPLDDGIHQSVAATELSFEQHDVVIGPALRQTALTGFLLGGAIAEVAVVNIDEGDRRLRIYAFGDGAWTLRHTIKLHSEVMFIDVANIGGRDRLVTYEPGRLNWLDPESFSEQELVSVTSNFKPPRREEIPHVDVTRDVNGDDRDDLVVPDVDGFWVFIQMSNGAFAAPVKIGPPTDMSGIYGADGYRYAPWSQSRVHAMDYNRDGRSDLVFWSGDHFQAHIQDERGLMNPVAKTFTTDVTFDSDDLFSLATGDMTGRVLHSLSDMNGDSVTDLIIASLEGGDISRKRSAYEVHFGSPTPDGGTEFAPGVDITFRSNDRMQLRKDRAYRSNDRIQSRMDRYDFNADGQVDLMFTTVDPYFLKSSLWKSMKGFMGDDILLGLEFYLMEGGRYRSTPNAIRITGLDGIPSHREPGSVPLEIVLRGATHERRKTQRIWPGAFNSTLLIGDVTGDGHSDLVFGSHPRQLEIFLGVPGQELFTQRSQGVRVTVPNDAEYVWLADLNRDGKQDILMHHPFILRDGHGTPLQPPGIEPHRLTMLIAR